MADRIATTRISDLPENITVQMPPGSYNPPQQNFNQPNNMGYGQDSQEPNTTYTQMNVHPNPYGIPPQNNVMSLPQTTQPPKNQNQFLPQYNMPQNEPQYRLPSRDIPVDPTQYLNDEQVQPNYIPMHKLTSDYIKDYEDENDIPIQEYKQKKHRESLIDTLLTELQTPIFIAILFFIFQMPIINTLMYKNLAFLPIYNIDGNANFYGLFLKSALFGLLYYGVSKFTNYISEL
jgi:hypothetical protein